MVGEGPIQRKLQPAGQIDCITTQITYLHISVKMSFVNTNYVFYITAHVIVKLHTLYDSCKYICSCWTFLQFSSWLFSTHSL